MSNDAQSMGKRIAMLRKEKGWTQEQLAEKLGVSAQAVSKWENDVSCPDITLLPLLASTLGVTTDELLGIEPIEPHVVVVENDGKRKKSDWNWEFNSGKRSSIITGCMLLLLGLIYLLANIEGIPITTEGNFWWIVLTLTLLGLGTGSFHKRFSFAGAGLILFSGYLFYVKLINPSAGLSFNIIWPVAIVLIGIGMIAQVFTRRHRVHRAHSGSNKVVSDYSDENGYVRATCSFCDEKAEFTKHEFRGADIDVSFGSYVLDLSEAETFSENCVIEADVSFGSCRIIVPEIVNVVKSVDNSFASCSIHGKPAPNAPYTAYVKGDISFGSIEIRYK
ncbi:MAG: helix-turn-helix domain-containing protein [Clostridia bacterium]|nr:helix-turn-helix domain-containing protein [Clostridia bacterium]